MSSIAHVKTLKSYRIFPSVRLWIFCLACLASTLIGSIYSTTNFAWVCMINTTHNGSAFPNVETLPWGKTEQQTVFAAYSIGGLVMSLVVGWLIDRFGSRMTLAVGLAISAVGTLLIPPITLADSLSYNDRYIIMAVLRVIVGMGSAVYWPMVYSVCTHWSPKKELGMAIAVVSSGFQAGQFINTPLAGVECSNLGWPYVYYLNGAAGFFFCILWVLLYREEPTGYWGISETECEMITTQRSIKRKEQVKTPWFALLTSLPVWSCIVCRFAIVYISFAVNMFTPTYLHDTLKVSIQGNGFLSSLPLLCQLVGRLISGPLADIRLRSITFRLKFFSTIALLGSGLFALGLGFVKPGAAQAVPIVLLCGVMVTTSFVTGGFQKSPLHMAPQHSGVIGSAVNMGGMVGSIAMPYVVGGITSDGTTEQWHIVFYTVAALGIIGTLCFLVFGSGELQSWAKPKEQVACVSSIEKNRESNSFETDAAFVTKL